MSAFRSIVSRRTPLAFAAVQRAGFATSRVSWAGKESALHSEGRADEIDAKKREQLNKQKQGKGEWEESLASDSESAVKADRSETGENTQEQIRKLQEEAKKVGQK